jgi:transcription elongation GreA/GreB family factor
VALLNKHLIIQQIIGVLTAELEGYARSARAAHAEATDEQSKAENKYDTRGLEASYLAQGQSRQAAEVIRAIQQYEALSVREFGPQEALGIGAIVELDGDGERTFYFLGPCAGGTAIEHEGTTVLVLTAHSPLGRQLIGTRQGDTLQIQRGRARVSCKVASVC